MIKQKENISCSVGDWEAVDNHHAPEFEEFDINTGELRHTTSITDLRECLDARRDTCPYSVTVKIDTAYIKVQKLFCAFKLRKS